MVQTRDNVTTPVFWLGVALVTTLAALTRLWGVGPSGEAVGLDYFGLWYDEAFSGILALKPWGEMILAAQQDVHPPLFYVLLKVWYALAPGGSVDAAWTRLLPTLIGIACAPAVIWLGAVVFSRRVGLLAGLLIAVSPYHIHYSHEARMYSLGCLVLSFELLCLWRAGRQPTAVNLALFGACGALALYTHYYAVILLAPHAAWFFLVRWRAGDNSLLASRRTLLLTLSVMLFYLPWFPTFLVHSLNNTGGVHAFESGASRADVMQYLFEWTLGLMPSFPFETAGRLLAPYPKSLAVGALLYGLVATAIAVLARDGRRDRCEARDKAWFAGATFLLPIALTGLYVLGPGRYYPRCAVFLFPITFCLIASGILRLPRPIYQVAVVLAILSAFMASTRSYLRDGFFRDHHHMASEFLRRAPDGPILCSRSFDMMPTRFYDLPADRCLLLNSPDVSLIQTIMHGPDRIITGPDQLPTSRYVLLVVSNWDFAASDDAERESKRQARIAEIERRWLAGARPGDTRLFYPRTFKWVYCGLYPNPSASVSP